MLNLPVSAFNALIIVELFTRGLLFQYPRVLFHIRALSFRPVVYVAVDLLPTPAN